MGTWASSPQAAVEILHTRHVADEADEKGRN